ncbi:MAG: MgtC/SapB family protein [Clostridiales bacterium]|nr:MgtC/SapB family protein [Clostridiales bacterium]
MSDYLMTQLVFLMKLIVAGICGAVIGYERKSHLKEAGIRTHMLVAIGSALIMIISKYGFGDISTIEGFSMDPSRIAAQIVTGIGFLGAGMIFVRKQTINGLTTAAGIWATAGIGMAIGTNLYFAGVTATILVFLVQAVLQREFKWLNIPSVKQINIYIDTGADSVNEVREMLEAKLQEDKLDVIKFKAAKKESGVTEIEVYIKAPAGYRMTNLLSLFIDNPNIRMIEV